MYINNACTAYTRNIHAYICVCQEADASEILGNTRMSRVDHTNAFEYLISEATNSRPLALDDSTDKDA